MNQIRDELWADGLKHQCSNHTYCSSCHITRTNRTDNNVCVQYCWYGHVVVRILRLMICALK